MAPSGLSHFGKLRQWKPGCPNSKFLAALITECDNKTSQTPFGPSFKKLTTDFKIIITRKSMTGIAQWDRFYQKVYCNEWQKVSQPLQ